MPKNDTRNSFEDYPEYLRSESALVRGKASRILASVEADDIVLREDAIRVALAKEEDPDAFMNMTSALLSINKENWEYIQSTVETRKGTRVYSEFIQYKSAFLRQIQNWDKVQEELKNRSDTE